MTCRDVLKGDPLPWLLEPEDPIVLLLLQVGYGDDPRSRVALAWLLDTQRDDGMWHCREDDRYGCLRATLDVLRAAAVDPETAAQASIVRGAEAACALLMERCMGRYYVPICGRCWNTPTSATACSVASMPWGGWAIAGSGKRSPRHWTMY
jgi:hypothetical protein